MTNTKLISLGAFALLATVANAQWTDILTSGHADVGVGYSNAGDWDLHIHNILGELDPAETLLYAGDLARQTVGAGSQWDFLGSSAGSTFWVLPQTQMANVLYLGLAAEEINSGIFQNESIVFELVDVRGPGHFSLYRDGASPIVYMASSDGIDSGLDRTSVFVGGHAHYNWAFSSAGMYEIDFRARGSLLNGNEVVSDITTYNFGVEAVPEPATMAVLAAGAALVAARRRRKA